MRKRLAYIVGLTVFLGFCLANAQDHDIDPDVDLPVHPSLLKKPETPTPPIPPPAPTPTPDDSSISTLDLPVVVETPEEPPPVFYGEDIDVVDNRIVYVLDRSSSMGGDRWTSLVREATRSILGLPPSFSFNVVLYNCEMEACWSDSLRIASAENKTYAVEWLAKKQPASGTGTGPAVVAALNFDTKCIVLLTDGEPTCPGNYTEITGPWKQALWSPQAVMNGHRRMIRDNNHDGTVINVFGIEANHEYRSFCIGIATDNNGSYFDVR